jgi:hypothetical protein
MEKNLSALERNVRLRNGRRALPVELPRPWVFDAFETLGHIIGYTVIAATCGAAMYVGLAIADRQYRVIDQINQEASRLPPCLTEDSDNCYWDAKERGNGKGHSFTTINGETYYDQRP